MLKKIFTSDVALQIKINLFKSSVISVLLYGCKTWTLTDHLFNQLDTFGVSCYRIMLGI